MGIELFMKEFENVGFIFINDKNDKLDYVVFGFDIILIYEKILIGCDYIRDGVLFIVIYLDFNCFIEDNKYMLDIGFMIRMFEVFIGVFFVIIGKLNGYIVEVIMEKYSFKKEDVVIVGDRFYIDIKIGVNVGIISIFVLSGEILEEMYKKFDIYLDYVFLLIKYIGEELK